LANLIFRLKTDSFAKFAAARVFSVNGSENRDKQVGYPSGGTGI
jgi:hypothetical protein